MRIAVDLARLDALVLRMAVFEQQLDAARAHVDAQAQRLGAVWTGESAARQQATHARWRGAAQELHAALGVLRAIGTTAHGNYAAAIAANRAMWS